MRPYTTYKAFGGILVVLTLPNIIISILGLGRDAPLPLPGLIFLAFLASLGKGIFVYSDRAMKSAMKGNEAEKKTGYRPDWKAMGILAGVLLLYLAWVAAQALHWI